MIPQEETALDWEWRRCGGGKVGASVVWLGTELDQERPGGDETVAVTRGRTVTIFKYREALGKLEAVADMKGHDGSVTLVDVVRGQKQCITGAQDGTWRLWDSTDGALLKVWDAAANVDVGTMRALSHTTSAWACIASKEQAVVLARDLITGKVETLMPLPGPATAKLLLAVAGKSVAVSAGRQFAVTRWSGRPGPVLALQHTRTITALALHPFDGSVAVGDDAGVVTVYRALAEAKDSDTTWPNRWLKDYQDGAAADFSKSSNLIVQRGDVPHSTHHWHAHTVTALAFTPEGNTLFSGGQESVLVAWQLSSGTRRFLPRLGSATSITHISSNSTGTVLSVTTADNAVRFVSTLSWTIEAQLRGVRPPMADSRSAKIAVDPNSPGYVMLCGLPSSLQVYDIFRDEHITDLTISGDNAISKGDDNTPALPSVDLAVLSSDGMVLVTVDYISPHADHESPTSSRFSTECLRFWRRDDNLGIFVVDTVVTEPDRGGRITQIVFHPTSGIMLSVSSAGLLRVWKQCGNDEDDQIWGCVSCETYRDMPFADCALSPDGSIIAIASGAVLVLWGVDALSGEVEFIQALSHAPPSEVITAVSFPGRESTLVAAATTKSLYVWNTMGMVVWWSCRLDILAMAHDPFKDQIAVAVRLPPPDSLKTTVKRRKRMNESSSSCVAVFDSNSPSPLAVHRLAGGTSVRSLTFLSFENEEGSGKKETCLSWLDDALEFHALFPPKVSPPLRRKDHHESEVGLNQDTWIGRRRKLDQRVTQWQDSRQSGFRQLRENLRVDTHILPSASSLLKSMSSSLRTVRDEESSEENDEKDDPVDEVPSEGDSVRLGDASLPPSPAPKFERAKRWGQYDEHGDSILKFASFLDGLLGAVSPRNARPKLDDRLGDDQDNALGEELSETKTASTKIEVAVEKQPGIRAPSSPPARRVTRSRSSKLGVQSSLVEGGASSSETLRPRKKRPDSVASGTPSKTRRLTGGS